MLYVFDSVKKYLVHKSDVLCQLECFRFRKKDSVILFVNLTRLVTLYAFDSLKITGLCESFVQELDYNGR